MAFILRVTCRNEHFRRMWTNVVKGVLSKPQQQLNSICSKVTQRCPLQLDRLIVHHRLNFRCPEKFLLDSIMKKFTRLGWRMHHLPHLVQW